MTNIVTLRTAAAAGADDPNKSLAEFDAKIRLVPFTTEEATKAKEIATRPSGTYTETVTPGMASFWWQNNNNRYNRDFRISKAEDYGKQMADGMWRPKAAGAIHFYPDGNLGNGQHRDAGCAISGVNWETLVITGIDELDMRAMDRGGTRTVADTLGMIGIEQNRYVAYLAKSVMNYQLSFANPGGSSKLSEQAVETFVVDNRTMVDKAVSIGQGSVHNVQMPSTNIKNAGAIALLMLSGGWQESYVRVFLSGIQTGQADSADSPILIFAKMLAKSRDSEVKGNKLKGNALLGTALKAATVWSKGMHATQGAIKFKPAAGVRLPDYRMPEGITMRGDQPVASAQAAE